MSKTVDMTGMKIGKLTVVEMLPQYKNGKMYCRCNCDCGAANIIREAYQLRHANDSSCGCGKKEYIRKSCGKEIDGMKFGRLTVMETLWNESPVKVKCRCDCGATGIYIKSDVMQGHTQSCGCLQIERTSEANFVDQSDKISDFGVKIISKAEQNNKGQWLWNCQCGYCGAIFKELPARVMNNHVRSCGCLVSSSAEKYIEKYLKENNIDYISQYTFPDLFSNSSYRKYPLRFDFAVFKNNSLYCLIEYDGQQHFHPVSKFGGEKGFNESVERDKIKNQYCKDHNIKLIRIPYTVNTTEIKGIIQDIINP